MGIQRRQLSSGCGAEVLKVLLALMCCTGAARAQFSPGPLSKAHHALDDPTHCTSCHVGGGGARKFRCLACHSDIRQRLAANRGLHPSLLQKGAPDGQCARCHSDHNGANFVPIRWDVSLDEFDHGKTGYALEGGHARLKCAQCHNPERITPDARRGILLKDLKRTYLGLGRDCSACHKDEHQGQLGAACDRCHTVATWKDVTRFNHATSSYPLTGAHQRTPCQKCHAPAASQDGGKMHVRYVGIAFAQCNACHQDPHRGAFTSPCSSCHNDTAWKPARNTNLAFDHSKTNFPLLARHAAVSCDKCHRTSDYKAPVAHDLCGACHKDVHGGQFLTTTGGADCARCHTADGWKTSTYTAAAHSKSAYPLIGRHAAVKCEACHKPAGAATLYRVAFRLCTDCHRDPHEAQFANASCEDCHTVDRFRPAKFPLTAHARTRFPLDGAHAAVACIDCHTSRAERPTTAVYRFGDLSCESCHQDPHLGQFRTAVAGKPGASVGCAGCHTTGAWRDVSKFDHSATQFALSGGHRAVACDLCHKATSLSTGLQRGLFRGTPTKCSGCHADNHVGQFHTATQQAECDVCHNITKWRVAAFDHSRTGFPLIGVHDQVPCRDCHKNNREVNGRLVLFYKPTPKECSDCHATTVHN
jgi:hypothetical protein